MPNIWNFATEVPFMDKSFTSKCSWPSVASAGGSRSSKWFHEMPDNVHTTSWPWLISKDADRRPWAEYSLPVSSISAESFWWHIWQKDDQNMIKHVHMYYTVLYVWYIHCIYRVLIIELCDSVCAGQKLLKPSRQTKKKWQLFIARSTARRKFQCTSAAHPSQLFGCGWLWLLAWGTSINVAKAYLR